MHFRVLFRSPIYLNRCRYLPNFRRTFSLNFGQRSLANFEKKSSQLNHFGWNQFRFNQTAVKVDPRKEKDMPGKTQETFARLPKTVVPSHYKIYLKPGLETFKFTGTVDIDVKVVESTDTLKLNAFRLSITSAKIKAADGEKPLTVEYNEKAQTVTLKCASKLPVGDAVLHIQFDGTHSDSMQGFYRSKYVLEGKEKYMVSTQFESTDARQSFPCWDEPIYKATFDVILEVPENRVALSNMGVKHEEKSGNGLKKITYATTPIMSTYLVAFAVGELQYIETKTKSDVTVRVYTLPGRQEQGRFALDCAKKSIEFFEEFFNIKYALPKADLLAVPDFSMGAMENWGLITFREIAILVDPKHSSGAVKQRIALTVSHEVAHMWFGNLVTMEWWTDLWLKEGFASFMEYLFCSKIYPEFNIWVAFLTDEIARAFKLDALKSSHPIEVPIDNPNEVSEIYDAVSYAKGNSIIRMLYSHLGERTFQKGIQAYLQKFKYGNAKTVDLWDNMSKMSGQDIAALMGVWTSDMGYPVISVEGKPGEGNKVTLEMTQKHFFADGSEEAESPVWQIPVNVVVGSNPTNVIKFLMKSEDADFPLDNVPKDDWIKLNAGVTGYYRVEYSKEMLQKLLPAIKNKQLSVIDRFNVINDLFALIRAGSICSTQFLEIVESCVDETEYLIWDEIDMAIGTIGNILLREKKIKDKFDAFVRKNYAKVVQHVGWQKKKDETHQQTLLRTLVLSRAAKVKDEKVLKVGKEKFAEHVQKKAELDSDLRGAIYGMNGRFADEKTFDTLKKIMETTDFSEVRVNCIAAIACCQNEKMIPEIFKFAMESGKVRNQDLHYIFFSMIGWDKGQDAAWQYFKGNMNAILARYGGTADNNIFTAIVKICTQMQSDDKMAREVEDFFAGTEYSRVLNRPVRQACENIRLNASHKARDADKIEKWLAQKGY